MSDPLEIVKQRQQEILDSNDWLRNKVNPARRLLEHGKYIQRHFPELGVGMPSKRFLDIGCGPGESLRIARNGGHDGMGIETPVGEGGMGSDYVNYGICNHIIHELNVIWAPVWRAFEVLPEGQFDCVNSRGSLEQCFSKWMIGEPHHVHHQASRMSWPLEDGTAGHQLMVFSQMISKCMADRGRIVIHANGSKNHRQMKPVLLQAFKDASIDGYWIEEHIYYGTKS